MARCSYCRDWNAGHNKIGCPRRKEDVKRYREAHEAGELDYYPSILSADDRYRQKKARKCSYCYNRHYEHETEHNRRNCPRLKQDRAEMESLNMEWRLKAISLLKEMGLGPGAIIRDDQCGLGVVTEFYWDRMSHLITNGHQTDACFSVNFFKNPSYERTFRWLREEGTRNYWGAWKGPDEVIVRASERTINANIPSGWAEGKTGLDFFFDRKYDKHC